MLRAWPHKALKTKRELCCISKQAVANVWTDRSWFVAVDMLEKACARPFGILIRFC